MKAGRVLRYAGIAAASIFVFLILYFTAVLIGGTVRVGPKTSNASVKTAAAGQSLSGSGIILDSNGRHIDLWIPAEYCSFMAGEPFSGSPDAGGWYGFGWGDRAFFLNTPYADDVSIRLVLNALFVPSRSILAVQYSQKTPAGRIVSANPGELSEVSACIESWFKLGGDSLQRVPEAEADPSYIGYLFYESRGRYSLFFTSNNWVNRVLKAGGLPARLWTPLVFGLE